MKSRNIDVAIKSPLHIDLQFKFCGYHEKLPPGNLFGGTICGDYIIQYCTEGKGEFIVEDKTYYIKKGDCFITFPGQTRIEKADQTRPWGLMWIGITGKSAEEFMKKINVSKVNPIISGLENTEIPLIMKSIIETAESIGFERGFLLSQKIFTLFDKMSESANFSENKFANQADAYVTQALYYLDIHYSDKELSIQTLADNIGLNRSYLYKIFKEKTGLSPQEYITKVRIKNAVEFMSYPQATVTSVSNSVGYEPSVFSKAFKKVFGISPKEYMNNNICTPESN